MFQVNIQQCLDFVLYEHQHGKTSTKSTYAQTPPLLTLKLWSECGNDLEAFKNKMIKVNKNVTYPAYSQCTLVQAVHKLNSHDNVVDVIKPALKSLLSERILLQDPKFNNPLKPFQSPPHQSVCKGDIFYGDEYLMEVKSEGTLPGDELLHVDSIEIHELPKRIISTISQVFSYVTEGRVYTVDNEIKFSRQPISFSLISKYNKTWIVYYDTDTPTTLYISPSYDRSHLILAVYYVLHLRTIGKKDIPESLKTLIKQAKVEDKQRELDSKLPREPMPRQHSKPNKDKKKFSGGSGGKSAGEQCHITIDSKDSLLQVTVLNHSTQKRKSTESADSGCCSEVTAEDLWEAFGAGYGVLGSGRSGFVLDVEIGGNHIAVKRCDLFKTPRVITVELKSESQVLRKLNNLNVECVPTLFFDGKVGPYYCLAMDKIEGKCVRFEAMSRTEARGCIAALEQLHKHHIKHGDLRCENFLVSCQQEQVFIIDFGLSMDYDRDHQLSGDTNMNMELEAEMRLLKSKFARFTLSNESH
jgi:predicted Ser/Thr protein kinase